MDIVNPFNEIQPLKRLASGIRYFRQVFFSKISGLSSDDLHLLNGSTFFLIRERFYNFFAPG